MRLFYFFVGVEQRKGQRVFASKARGWIDLRVVAGGRRLSDIWHHFARYILQLGWYYSLHKLLQTILKTLVAFYSYVERIFERNRSKALKLRAEKRDESKVDSHLKKMADHKVETTLTPAQKEKLKKDKLEERH